MSLPSLAIRLHSGMDARHAAQLARCAEDAGFSRVWFAENPYGRGVLPAMAACALATERIEIGIGCFNPFNRHPTLMAMEIGALDELSRGRAILGVGSGVPAWVEKIAPYQRIVSAVRDTIHIAGPLLAGETVEYDGRMYSAHGVRLEFDLVRDRMPIYVAAMGDQVLRLTGELGDGVLIGNMCPPAFHRRAIDRMDEGAARARRNRPSDLVRYSPLAIGLDGAAARGAMLDSIGATLRVFCELYAASEGSSAAIRDGNGIEPEQFDRALGRIAAGEPGAMVLDPAFIDAYGIAGTPEDCRRQLERHAASGITEMAFTILGDAPEESIRRIGAAVRG